MCTLFDTTSYPVTLSRLSWHFLHRPEIFQFIQTLFRSSRHFPANPDTLDTLYSIRTFPKWSGNSSADYELAAKTFRICKNFPCSNAILLALKDGEVIVDRVVRLIWSWKFSSWRLPNIKWEMSFLFSQIGAGLSCSMCVWEFAEYWLALVNNFFNLGAHPTNGSINFWPQKPGRLPFCSRFVCWDSANTIRATPTNSTSSLPQILEEFLHKSK